MQKVDIILPLYKPRGEWVAHIIEALDGLNNYFKDKDCELKIFVVNDGSSLSYYPEESLQRIARHAKNFQFLSYEKNRGKGYSLRHGISHTEGDFQIYTDGDFPFSWEGVVQAYEILNAGADVAQGVRNSDYALALSPMRKQLSANVRRMNRILLGMPDTLLDTQAGLKGFNHKGKKLFLSTKVETFLFDTEFILLAWKHKLKIVPVNLKLRSGLSFSRMGLKVMLQELFNFGIILLKYRMKPRREFVDEK